MPKLIVSHHSPDLDSITGIWLLMRFGGMEEAELEFVSAGSTFRNMPVDSNPDIVHVDTGMGKFDHHQKEQNETFTCATKLVAEAYAPNDSAVKRLVDFVNLVDNGKAPFEQMIQPFSIVRLIRGLKILYPRDPAKIVHTILPCLDAWYASAQEEEAFYKEFEKKQEFQTRWGLGIALESDIPAAAPMAYRQGAVVFVYQGSKGNLGITAPPTSEVDLTELYEHLRMLEPSADWYLHPSKKMLLCGSGKTREAKLSQLKLADLVNLLAVKDTSN